MIIVKHVVVVVDIGEVNSVCIVMRSSRFVPKHVVDLRGFCAAFFAQFISLVDPLAEAYLELLVSFLMTTVPGLIDTLQCVGFNHTASYSEKT